MDVKAKDSQGRIYHVEVQVGFQALFSKRSLYYLASLIRDQLSVSEEYSQLKPVYQINIIDFGLFETTRYLSSFTLREDTELDIQLTKDLQVVYIELPKFEKTLEEVQTHLDAWLYLFRHSQDIGEYEMNYLVFKESDMANAAKIKV